MPIIAFRVFFIFTLLGIITLGISSRRGWLDYRRMVKQNSELKGKVVESQAYRSKLLHEIESLQNSPLHQEVMIRQTLGYVRPGELVIEFP